MCGNCASSAYIEAKITGELLLIGGGASLLPFAGLAGAAIVAGSLAAPVINAGLALGLACAAPALIIHRVASNIIDKIDSEHQYPKTARFFKILSFAAGLAVGVGVSAGILAASATALGVSLGAGLAAIGATALAMTVCFVAYLALRGLYNMTHAFLNRPSVTVMSL